MILLKVELSRSFDFYSCHMSVKTNSCLHFRMLFIFLCIIRCRLQLHNYEILFKNLVLISCIPVVMELNFFFFFSSDLDPIQAPQWSVRVRKADNPQCLLGKTSQFCIFFYCF